MSTSNVDFRIEVVDKAASPLERISAALDAQYGALSPEQKAAWDIDAKFTVDMALYGHGVDRYGFHNVRIRNGDTHVYAHGATCRHCGEVVA